MDLLRFLLLCLIALPAIAAAIVASLGPRRAAAIRWISLATTLIGLLLTVILVIGFISVRATPSTETFTPEIVPGASADRPHQTTWQLIPFGQLGAIQFFVGLDGLNLWLVALTTLLMVSAVLISWTSVTERVNEYYAWLLALGAGMVGVFLAFDVILFYVFFELTLVPLFFLIGIWGGPERRHAARKFFIYTLTGSVITLLGLLAVVAACYHLNREEPRQLFSIPALVDTLNGELKELSEKLVAVNEELGKVRKGPEQPMREEILGALQERAAGLEAELLSWRTFQFWVFLALFAGFAIKVPLVPLHTWLPLAHVEAPTAGSVLLAGVLLKIGAYGFLRLCLPLAPDASMSLGLPLIGLLSVIGIIYGAFCALAQDDIKKLVAYSSVSHLGFCMLGLFALNAAGLAGGLLQMINHGLSTGALFLLVGMLYERYHTRKLSDYGGMGARLGLLAFSMIFISLSSIGLPGLNGFVGEALVFFGMFATRPVLAVLGTAGILLGAWYMLSMIKSVFFGPLREPAHDGHEPVGDLNFRELAALVPIMALCLLLGVFPQPAINTARPDLDVVANILKKRGAAEQRIKASAREADRSGAAVAAGDNAGPAAHLVQGP
jgi:NADH-quinone oxidoreductase subunit M